MTDPSSVPEAVAATDQTDDQTDDRADDRTDDQTDVLTDASPAPASLAPGPSSRLVAPASADDRSGHDVPPDDVAGEQPLADEPAEEPAATMAELDDDALAGGRELVDAHPELGRLASIVVWLAGTQGAAPPQPFTSPVALVVTAAHDEARYVGQTPFAPRPPDAAELPVDGIPLRLLDLSSAGPWFVRTSSGDIRTTDALTQDEAVRAFALGRLAVDREVDGGADVLLVGALAGDSACAVAAVAATVTGRQPQTAVPRTGVATDVWIRTVEVVRDARARGKPLAGQALPLLAAIGGADLAALAGILVQAAQRRTPVLLAGPAVHVAGLVAETYAEGCSLWWTSASSSGDPAEAAALTALELEPVLDLGLGFDGCGSAVLAYGLIQDVLALL